MEGGDDEDDDDNQPSTKTQCSGWSWKLLGGDTTYMPPRFTFHGEEKITGTLPANPTAFDFFSLYFDDDIIDLIVAETNRYADQYISRNEIAPHSPVKTWQPTDRDEMKTFLGLATLMGIVFKPRLSMYWSTDSIYKTDIFGSCIACDRFLLWLKFLYFSDNDLFDAKDPNRDRLFKIRPLVSVICDRCANVYSPGWDLCVDESIVLFKGRLAFKQFIRTKREQFGIKLFELCTSNGIILDFLVYHGKMNEELLPQFQISESIPVTVMQRYLNKGHRLFVDNYYTTPALALHLLDNNMKLMGTVRANR